jgi:hypothetical protein
MPPGAPPTGCATRVPRWPHAPGPHKRALRGRVGRPHRGPWPLPRPEGRGEGLDVSGPPLALSSGDILQGLFRGCVIHFGVRGVGSGGALRVDMAVEGGGVGARGWRQHG